MAITIISSILLTAADGLNITIPFTGAVQDDVVVTFGGFAGGTSTAPGVISPTGYTSILVNDAADVDFKVEWKRLGSVVEPSILLAGSGAAADAGGYGAYILRGVTKAENPFIGVIQTSIASGVPQSPSIITAIDGSIVLAMAGNDVFDSSPGNVNEFAANMGSSTNDTDDFSVAGAASIFASGGSKAPGAWSTWTAGGYVSATVALAPALQTTFNNYLFPKGGDGMSVTEKIR